MFPKKTLVGWVWDFPPSLKTFDGFAINPKQRDNVLKCVESVLGPEARIASQEGFLQQGWAAGKRFWGLSE